MQSLDKHKHIEVHLKYINSLYMNQFYHEGRIMFEDLLLKYPKRSDLWFIYIGNNIY